MYPKTHRLEFVLSFNGNRQQMWKQNHKGKPAFSLNDLWYRCMASRYWENVCDLRWVALSNLTASFLPKPALIFSLNFYDNFKWVTFDPVNCGERWFRLRSAVGFDHRPFLSYAPCEVVTMIQGNPPKVNHPLKNAQIGKAWRHQWRGNPSLKTFARRRQPLRLLESKRV